MKRVNKKKKAFTLIELLAVIVILGIIATIVTATISKVTSNAKKQAFKESARGLIRAAESYMGEYILKNHQTPEFPMTFTCDGTSCKYNDIELDFAGEIPKSGAIIADGLKKVEASYLSDGKYCAAGTKTDIQVAESCADIDLNPPTVTGTASDLTFNLNLVDAESGIAAYCVTTTDDSSSCSWISTTSATLEHEVSANGTYYVFAKDNKGNISSSISLIAQRITFAEQILIDNPTIYTNPTLTTSSNNTQDPSGLYSMSVTNGFGGQSEEGTTYYFRGNVTNNYVTFASKTWRIVRINEDGSVRLVLENCIGVQPFGGSVSGATANMYYSNSSIKSVLDTWYDENIGNNEEYEQKIAVGQYFCEALKSNDASTHFECVEDDNGYSLLSNQYKIGMLALDEFIRAGGYYSQDNISFYLYNGINWWTMTPAGLYQTDTRYAATYPHVWFTNQRRTQLTMGVVNIQPNTRPVINLKSTVTVTGSGTSGNPYIVE